jgi:tRNA 2-thiocytidine biosynthesis protein TtcA
MLDQGLSNWDDSKVEQWLIENKIPYEILRRDTLSIIKEKISAKDNYCAFCSRLRRGVIYSYAKEHGLIKIALGHHRDDLISSLLMSILYNGNISSMAAKRLTDDKRHIIVRPLAYCQESDIIKYAAEQNFPIINAEKLCIFKNDAVRRDIKKLIAQLAKDNPKIPSNILHALKCVKPSKLLDKNLWDFKNLESSVIASEAKQSPD